MEYLFSAYLVIWLLIAGYVFNLQKKQNKLFEEIENLKKRLG
ncbi:CcmD family protein [candidate division KSB1 bacterium]